jgi:ribosome biogenesis GTPase A
MVSGHNARAKRKLEEQLRWWTVVIELCDARLPLSSRNPLLQELLGNKPRLLLLNKADLADPLKMNQWLTELGEKGPVLAVSALNGIGVKKIIVFLEDIFADKREQLAARGVRARPIRAMVVGIPNIGKSSLINQLPGGSQAKTGNKPGVTRGNQWIRIHPKLELLDTPGMLWPKFDDQETGRKLAATGAVKDEVFDQEELAAWLLQWLIVNYPGELERFYGLSPEELTLEGIGRNGMPLKRGRIDTLRRPSLPAGIPRRQGGKGS